MTLTRYSTTAYLLPRPSTAHDSIISIEAHLNTDMDERNPLL